MLKAPSLLLNDAKNIPLLRQNAAVKERFRITAIAPPDAVLSEKLFLPTQTLSFAPQADLRQGGGL